MNKCLLVTLAIITLLFAACSKNKKKSDACLYDTVFSGYYVNLQIDDTNVHLADCTTGCSGTIVRVSSYRFWTDSNTKGIALHVVAPSHYLYQGDIGFVPIGNGLYRLYNTQNTYLFTATQNGDFLEYDGVVNITHFDSTYIEGNMEGTGLKNSSVPDSFKLQFKVTSPSN